MRLWWYFYKQLLKMSEIEMIKTIIKYTDDFEMIKELSMILCYLYENKLKW